MLVPIKATYHSCLGPHCARSFSMLIKVSSYSQTRKTYSGCMQLGYCLSYFTTSCGESCKPVPQNESNAGQLQDWRSLEPPCLSGKPCFQSQLGDGSLPNINRMIFCLWFALSLRSVLHKHWDFLTVLLPLIIPLTLWLFIYQNTG